MDGGLWHCTGDREQDNTQEKEMKNKRKKGCLRKPYKYLWKEDKQKAKEKIKEIPFECRVPKNSKER